MTEQLFLQKIKEAIVSNELIFDENNFQPVKKVVLHIPLTLKNDELSTLPRETIYQLLGKAIFGDEK